MSLHEEVQRSARSEPVRIIYRVHESPGRLRLRLTWLRHQREEAERLADALSNVEGVVEVRVRAFTGSVLLLFDPALTDGARVTAALLAATGVDHVTEPGHETRADVEQILHDSLQSGSNLSSTLVRAIEGMHVDFLRLTGGRVSLGALSVLAFWGGAAAKVARQGQLEAPPWYQLVWWGFKSFYDLEKTAIKSAPEPSELLE